jgi:Ca2+-binding RTX toxin-like protein
MTYLPKWVALAAAAASMGALVIPAGASATVQPPQVNNNTLTVTSDDQGDAITLSVVTGNIAVNGTATTLAANNNAIIEVNANGGDDTVDASALAAANYAALTIHGGEGDDLLIGGADNDVVAGDGGDDRVIGGKGEDSLFGGEGTDTLVWNNGDNSDEDDGGPGVDEVEVNGAPTAGDAFTARPSAALPGWVQFNRTNLVNFQIDLLAERLTVNGLGGADMFQPDPAAPTGLAPLTALTLNGGTGADALFGGDGADKINGGAGTDQLGGGDGPDVIAGGDDNDAIIGEGGDDRLIGDRGTDLLAGSEGDDTLVWNNGDGSDDEEGDAGFDSVEVNGSTTAGDTFKLSPNGLSAKFERTNLVPFTLSVRDDVEAVNTNGGGGNDELTVEPGIQNLLVAADGDSGDDKLIGSGEPDTFLGGSGSDTIDGGGGSDLIDGEQDNDHLFSRDGTGDLVRGGAGFDTAQTDSTTVDAVSGIEALDAPAAGAADPAAGDTRALLPQIGSIKVTRSGRSLVARVSLSCPMAEAGGCRTTVTIETAKAVRLGKVRAVLVLGSKTVALRPGQQTTVSVRLAGAGSLAKHGKLAARVREASSDAAGNLAARSLKVGLRIPHR